MFKDLYIAKLIFSTIFIIIISSILSRYQYAFMPPSIFKDDGLDNIEFIILRELGWLLLSLISLFLIFTSKNKLIVFCLIFSYLLLLLTRDIVGGNTENTLYGIRILLVFLSIPAISFMFEKISLLKIKKYMSFLVKFIILVLIPITIYQLMFFPPSFGATFLGARVNGFYYNPIIFSMFLSSLSLILYVLKSKNYKIWILLIVLICLCTGGRAGILISLMLLISSYMGIFIKNKISIVGLFFVIAPLFFLILSSSEISGREATSEKGLKDGRLDVWGEWLNTLFQNSNDFIFGVSVGTGTNASVKFSTGSIADSMFITIFTSFGFVGFFIFFLIIFYYFLKINSQTFLILLVIMFLGLAQNIPEVNPINIMLIFSIVYSHYYGLSKDVIGISRRKYNGFN